MSNTDYQPVSLPEIRQPQIIDQSLSVLRRLLRTYMFFDGLVVVVFYVVFIFVLDFLLDRFFQFSLTVRVVLFPLIIFGIFYVVWRYLLSLLFIKIKGSQLAYLFERYVPDLKESLVTTVEIGNTRYRSGEVVPEFLQETMTTASDKLRGVNVHKFFRFGRLTFRIFSAVVLLCVAVFFCVKFAETAEMWFSRNLLLSELDWPRRSRLVVDGFNGNFIRIGRGDSFTLIVRADTSMPLVPDTVRLRVGSSESGYRVILIDQFRIDKVDNLDWRIFSYTFVELLETVKLRVQGADSIVDGLTIEVVPPPVLSDVKITQTFPSYMQRETRTITPSIRTTIPDGTSIDIAMTASKPLTNAKITINNKETLTIREENLSAPFSEFGYSLQNLRDDTSLIFQIQDTDNLRNKQTIRFEFNIMKDQPPSVTTRLDGIGSAITPNAVLPTVGEITDDNGLSNAQYNYTIQRKPPDENDPNKNIDKKSDDQNSGDQNQISQNQGRQNQPPRFELRSFAAFAMQSDDDKKTDTEKTDTNDSDLTKKDSDLTKSNEESGTVIISGIGRMQTLFTVNNEFKVEDLKLVPGDKLVLRVEAMDKFDLDPPQKYQVGVGQDWGVEVVTAERLKGLLEVREISLRQRFEVLIGEVETTKRLVDVENYPLDPTESQVKEIDAMKIPDDTPEEEKPKRQAELDNKKKELLDTIPKEQSTRGQYHISRALRDTQKEVYELRAIVESFKMIRREMINNKIFNSDLESRIDGGIISPITALVERDFPELDRLINAFEKTILINNKPIRQEAIAKRKIALDQFDLIIKKMTTIRDSMVSMESFNEVIEILRDILKNQREIQQETEIERKQQLKDLLKED
ncbi:MAG: hypothetical protein LBQ66_14870 [Planctomycetaceae bacterium]|jgi:hypothetical protein|nr:hypothetical protein [Planctomycetaceae bacterium]